MSLPVVVHFNQRFCLFFNTDRLLNDQVQQVRHLNNDVIRRVLGVINEPLMNAIVTKMSASMGRSGNSFRKSEGVDTASQGSCRNTPVFTEPLKGVTKQSGRRPCLLLQTRRHKRLHFCQQRRPRLRSR